MSTRSITLRELEYLNAVAEYRHFGAAAEHCKVTQPTMSMQIRKLEDLLGIVLIERTKRRVSLTPAGEAIVEQARVILEEQRKLVQIAARHNDPLGGELRLGVIPTVAPYLLPRVLPLISAELPSLQVQISEWQTADNLNGLTNGAIDAAILALPVEQRNLQVKSLYREQFLFTVSRSHRLARKATVNLDDLENEDVLLLDDGHCLRDQALEVCTSHQAVANPNFRASSLETLREMVAANMGVTLMPEMAVRKGAKVKYIPFASNRPFREIGLVWRESSPRPELLQRLSEVLSTS